MRTSRVSRDTARVVGALSSSTRLAPRRSLRSQQQRDQSDSELSTPPSSQDESQPTSPGALGKRKRGTATTTSAATRQSPRKAAERDAAGAATQKKARRQPARRIKSEDGSVVVVPPSNWEEVYSVTTAMRKRIVAPVDTMGCESLAERNRSPVEQRLQTLVSLMLSSQTKDTVTAAAMRNLQTHLPGGFCLESLLAVEPAVLNELIGKVGFHNNKTKFIKAVAEILRDRHGGDIPDSIDGLVALPGVGPKMAYLCMSAAWGRDEGIGVDVHVHRITNLWRWHKTASPEQTRAALEAWLPREKWHDINHLLVGLGQTVCLPVGRRCGECDLAARKLCPSAVAGSPTKKRVKREVEIKVEDGTVVKDGETAVEADGAGYAVSIKQEAVGEVEVSGALGQVPDIEGIGAGAEKRVKRIIEDGT